MYSIQYWCHPLWIDIVFCHNSSNLFQFVLISFYLFLFKISRCQLYKKDFIYGYYELFFISFLNFTIISTFTIFCSEQSFYPKVYYWNLSFFLNFQYFSHLHLKRVWWQCFYLKTDMVYITLQMMQFFKLSLNVQQYPVRCHQRLLHKKASWYSCTDITYPYLNWWFYLLTHLHFFSFFSQSLFIFGWVWNHYKGIREIYMICSKWLCKLVRAFLSYQSCTDLSLQLRVTLQLRTSLIKLEL